MKEILSKNLIALAQEFKKQNSTLYIVGGFVRNYLLGLPLDDIDICGSLTGEQVAELCKKHKFSCVCVNKKLGTLLISKNDEHFEYTSFRKENYKKGGQHSPQSVEFITDINQDARRRDFTINCIYYDILSDKYFDPYNGMTDLKKRIIRCIETPQKVFSADGLRLLRLVRFASTLGFKVERKTIKYAKQYAYQLCDVSKERFAKELKLIVCADYKYGFKILKSIQLLNMLNLTKYAFNLSVKQFKINTRNIFYKKFLQADENLRYTAFLILVLLNYNNFSATSSQNIAFKIQRLFGNDGIKCGENLQGLFRAYLLIQQYYWGEINNFLLASYYDLSTAERLLVEVYCDKRVLSKGVLALKLNKIPLSEKELNITSEELMRVVAQNQISMAKQELLAMCLQGKLKNEKQELLNYIKHNDAYFLPKEN